METGPSKIKQIIQKCWMVIGPSIENSSAQSFQALWKSVTDDHLVRHEINKTMGYRVSDNVVKGAVKSYLAQKHDVGPAILQISFDNIKMKKHDKQAIVGQFIEKVAEQHEQDSLFLKDLCTPDFNFFIHARNDVINDMAARLKYPLLPTKHVPRYEQRLKETFCDFHKRPLTTPKLHEYETLLAMFYGDVYTVTGSTEHALSFIQENTFLLTKPSRYVKPVQPPQTPQDLAQAIQNMDSYNGDQKYRYKILALNIVASETADTIPVKRYVI